MKRIQSVLLAVGLLAAVTLCQAASSTTNSTSTNSAGQTVSTAPMPNITASLGLNTNATMGKVASDFLAALADAQPYVSNNTYTIEAGMMYNGTLPKGQMGGFMDVQVPVAGQTSIGFGGAYINDTWYDANIAAKVGTTINWITNTPLIGKYIGPVYTYASSGPDWSFKTHSVGAYNVVGFIKAWDISSKWNLSIGGGPGDISTIPGTTWFGGFGLTYKGK